MDTHDDVSSPASAHPPVALLHGALRGRVGMLPTVAFFGRLGLTARAFGYASRRGRLEDHAAALEASLGAWTGGPRPVPVLGMLTHSMGGLVARAYLARSGAYRLATRYRIVMLSPPNQGAELAARFRDSRWFRALYGDAAHELQPERVARLGPLPGGVRLLILAGGTGDPDRGLNPRLAGDNDGVVRVEEMGLGVIEPERIGGPHATLQWSPRVLRRAAAFFRTGA